MNTRSPLSHGAQLPDQEPVGRRATAAAALRTRLLDAAEVLLTERRPGAITSRDLARAAGVSDGVLYNHFADKHDVLLQALVRRFARLVADWAAQPSAAGGGSPSAGVADLIGRAHALQVAALPMLANLVGDPPLFQRFLVEIHRPPLGGDVFRRPVADHLAAEQALGRLGSFDPEVAADVILGSVLMQGLIDVLAHRPAPESERRLASLAAVILSGLGPVEPDTAKFPRPAGGVDDDAATA